MKKYLEIGEIVSVHGLRGDIKLYPWSDSAAALAKLKRLFFDDKGERLYKPEKISIQKNMLLIKLQGVDSVEAARSYIGKTVFAAREDIPLPKGSYFVQDLLGLKVVDAESGVTYGEISEVRNNGAHDYYYVKSESGAVNYFPAVPEFLVSTDIEKGQVLVKPIEGMFADEN